MPRTTTLLSLVCALPLLSCASAPDAYGGPGDLATALQVSSSAFVSQQPIPDEYTCGGEGISPPLRWSGVPSEARSLVLIVEDRDTARPFTHWLVYNLPTGVDLPEGTTPALPRGASNGTNDDQAVGWIPPCPPSGRHAYHFRVHALDTLLTGLDAPTRPQIEAAMQGHVLATGEIVGTYQRPLQ